MASLPMGTRFREFAKRTVGAAFGRATAYQAARDDRNANVQATCVATLAALGVAVADAELGLAHMAGLALAGMAHWPLWGLVARLIGVRLLGCSATHGEVMRTLAFARAPGILAALAFLPWVGGLLHAAAAPWMLVTGVIAVRHALRASLGKAALAAIPGLAPYWAALALLY